MKIDFNGIEKPVAQITTNRKSPVITPGINELTITALSEGTFSTGTAYVEITLQSTDKDVSYPIRERFACSQKAKPRLMYLYETVTGETLSGEVDTETWVPKFVGKTFNWMVNGEEYLNTKDDKVFTNVRPMLAFRDFINPPADAQPWIRPLPVADSSEAIVPTASAATDLGLPSITPDDLPF